MKNIKNIVVATDFSITARNAYRYALNLAKAFHATLTVIHVKESMIMVTDVVQTPVFNDDDSELMKDIQELIAEENLAEGVVATILEVKIKILTGNPVDVLTGLSKDKETDLIVIGTSGLSDVLEKVFGTTSIKVSNKAYCPVILVPREAKWHPIEKIMYASDFDSMKAKFAQDIIDFSVEIGAGIHFVNVRNYNPVGEINQKDIDWNELFVSNDSRLSYEKHTIYGNDTVNQLKDYSEKNKIDLIVFASKHRNFWESLMHRSISENMALSTFTPMMVIHSDDQR